jgi:hypothetical protein
MPVHADDRLNGRALGDLRERDGSVRHEEDRVPVVLTAGMRLGQVSLGLLDEVVLVLAGDRLAAGAVQMRLHMFTIAYQA